MARKSRPAAKRRPPIRPLFKTMHVAAGVAPPPYGLRFALSYPSYAGHTSTAQELAEGKARLANSSRLTLTQWQRETYTSKVSVPTKEPGWCVYPELQPESNEWGLVAL